MPSPQRQSRVHAMSEHLKAHVLMLKEELNLFFDSPVGVAAHPDYFKSIEEKIFELAEYDGALEAFDKHFGQSPKP